MKIGIDARLINETGVGRYIRNLIRELSKLDTHNSYVVFLRKNSYSEFETPNSRWEKRLADVPWHSVAEQLRMPGIFSRERLDILHVPYFNVPLFYFGKFVVTIHDLTILHFDTGRASTRAFLFYKIRRLGYSIILGAAMTRSQKIIAVSNSTKKEILNHFDVLPDDICVTHEGPDETAVVGKRLIPHPYFLYVGNAYPHKNVELLIRAFSRVPDETIVLVGKDDFFYKRLMKDGVPGNIKFFGPATPRQLANLYTNAKALVFPSLMEGFGLPALEALAYGCPVIASDIPVFRELFGNFPTYFDPHDEEALVQCLRQPPLRTNSFLAKAAALVKKYSWKTLARKTLNVYEDCNRL